MIKIANRRPPNKMAAYASRETGDARKAVELLAKAVKVAEKTTGRLTVDHVDVAAHQRELIRPSRF